MDIPSAAADIERFVAVVRYVAKRAREFRPSSPTEFERLSVTSHEIRLYLQLDPGDVSLARLGTLISDEGWQLCTSFGRTESVEWSFEVNIERARRYQNIKTIREFLDISNPNQRQQNRSLSLDNPDAPEGVDGSMDAIDLFISHASEDKGTARPLSKALEARGWSVWLDELELTVGDSLSGGIDAALARSRFGVVVLSPSFFVKQWPQRELAGLAAREVDAGSKVILPVWHEVDRQYIAERSPILADRLGALTSAGIEDVADKISLALKRAGVRAAAGHSPESVVQAVEPERGLSLLTIPTTTDELTRLVDEQRDWWEFLLYAGVLVRGKRELEGKWEDHELRLPHGPRREFDLAPPMTSSVERSHGSANALPSIASCHPLFTSRHLGLQVSQATPPRSKAWLAGFSRCTSRPSTGLPGYATRACRRSTRRFSRPRLVSSTGPCGPFGSSSTTWPLSSATPGVGCRWNGRAPDKAHLRTQARHRRRGRRTQRPRLGEAAERVGLAPRQGPLVSRRPGGRWIFGPGFNPISPPKNEQNSVPAPF